MIEDEDTRETLIKPSSISKIRPVPTYTIIAILCVFIFVTDFGVLLLFNRLDDIALAQCNRVNELRSLDLQDKLAQRAAIPQERYTETVKNYFDGAFARLHKTNCSDPGIVEVHFPAVPPREVGEGPVSSTIPGMINSFSGERGPQGEMGPQGEPGPQGSVGAQGEPGEDGEDGVTTIIIESTSTTIPSTTTTTICVLLCPP